MVLKPNLIGNISMAYLQYFAPNVPIGIRRQPLSRVGGSGALLIDFKRHHKTKKCSQNPPTIQIYHFEQRVEHSRVGAPPSKTTPQPPVGQTNGI